MKWKNISTSQLALRFSLVGSVIGVPILIKQYITGVGYPDEADLTGKTVIITGANSGIGKETARELSSRNARVILACRDMKACAEAKRDIFYSTANTALVCRTCDLSSLDSIRSFVKKFEETEERLDILINNAGVMRCPRSVTKEGIEMQLGVNHMGHFLLTNLLMDKLKSCAPSRIINVSSVAHMRGNIDFTDLNSEKEYDSAKAYNQSKLANIHFTMELAKRLEGTKVTACAVHPGLVNTNIDRHMGVSNSFWGKIIFRPIAMFFLKTPKQGAQTNIYAAVEPSLEGVSGKYYSNCAESTVPPKVDDEVAKRLWAVSEKWTRLS